MTLRASAHLRAISTCRRSLWVGVVVVLALGCGEAAAPTADATKVAADAAPADSGPTDSAPDVEMEAADGDVAPDIVDTSLALDADAAADSEPDSQPEVSDAVPLADAEPTPSCASASDCALVEGDLGPCRVWTCVSGDCVALPLAASTPCAVVGPCLSLGCDGNGACDLPMVATCSSQPCSVAWCDLSTGACASAPAPATTPCDDANPCSVGDHCDGKAGCAAGLPLACTATTCQTATCNPISGACAAQPLPAGATCSDGDPCTLGDSCSGQGTCASGPQPSCPSTACATGGCDAASGGCILVPTIGACQDGEPCTVGDTCLGGQCAPGPWVCECGSDLDCDDSNPCTGDACAGGECLQLPVPPTSCDDAQACTTGEQCAGGWCGGGKPLGCDDGDPCTADWCPPAKGGCAHAQVTELACSDGDPCTLGDVCGATGCQGGQPMACPDPGPCLVAACAVSLGACATAAAAGPCSDGNACTLGDTCGGGACQPGAPVLCDDANPCTVDACDPASGSCQAAPQPTGVPCGAGKACSAGKCQCALGEFAVAPIGLEWLRAARPAGNGWVAVGDSDQPGQERGLLVVADGSGQATLIRRLAAPGGLSLVGAAAQGPGYVLAGTVGAATPVLLHCDAQGNVDSQSALPYPGQAQALAPVGSGQWLVLTTDPWAEGAATRLLRVSAAGTVLWELAIPPASPTGAARAHTLALSAAGVLVVGQDLEVAQPWQSGGWCARASGELGTLLGKTPLGLGPPGAVVLGASVQDSWLALAGTSLSPSGKLGGRWSALANLDAATGLPLPGAATAAEGVESAWSAVEAAPDGALIWAGWSTTTVAHATLRKTLGNATQWSWTSTGLSADDLHSLTVAADGTVIAVGSRDTASGSQGWWVHLSAQGAMTCAP